MQCSFITSYDKTIANRRPFCCPRAKVSTHQQHWAGKWGIFSALQNWHHRTSIIRHQDFLNEGGPTWSAPIRWKCPLFWKTSFFKNLLFCTMYSLKYIYFFNCPCGKWLIFHFPRDSSYPCLSLFQCNVFPACSFYLSFVSLLPLARVNSMVVRPDRADIWKNL